MEAIRKLFKLDFAQGKKTYATAIVALIVLWLGPVFGTDMFCEVGNLLDSASATCGKTSAGDAFKVTLGILGAVFVKKGIDRAGGNA